MINVFQPSLGERELAAVAEVFASNWVGKGPRTEEFEAAFAGHLGVGADRVLTVNSCTEGLFLAMELAGAGPGDEVVMPAVSFVGAGNAVASRGAKPVFCDVDRRTLNPTVDQVASAITQDTRAVILLHYGGYPGEVAEIAARCREKGIFLVEDSACAVASTVDGQACGTFGDVGVWSFDGAKIVVTGDGGMLTARDPQLIERAAKLTYFGLEQFSGFSQAKAASKRWWEFQVSSFSRRSIMNDIQSAIGTVQLGRLDEFLRRREEIAARYDAELADLGQVRLPPPLPPGHVSSYYLYWIQLDPAIRDEVAQDLYRRGIYTTFRYAALHQVAAYGARVSLPEAEKAVAETLCLPLHQGLSDADVDTIIDAVRESVTARTRGAAA